MLTRLAEIRREAGDWEAIVQPLTSGKEALEANWEEAKGP